MKLKDRFMDFLVNERVGRVIVWILVAALLLLSVAVVAVNVIFSLSGLITLLSVVILLLIFFAINYILDALADRSKGPLDSP